MASGQLHVILCAKHGFSGTGIDDCIEDYYVDLIRPGTVVCLTNLLIPPFVLLLFYAIETVFCLYHGGDIMCKMRKRKPERTHLLTLGIIIVPYYIGMVRGPGF